MTVDKKMICYERWVTLEVYQFCIKSKWIWAAEG